MSKGRILCTEDDPDSREMLVLTLQSHGYEVVCPVDSIAALEIARTELFDLLLLDTWMPGLTGNELTREIRKTNQTTPILFYSGAGTQTEIQEALKAGAQGYLVKPQGIEGLTTEIAKLIEAARSTCSNETR